MKTITTSKGEFVVVDMDSLTSDVREQMFVNSLNNFSGICIDDNLYEEICKLSEATEEDAKGVVDENGGGYFDYNIGRFASYFALHSLHSLLKSKGIDVNSGNWYLFKKI